MKNLLLTLLLLSTTLFASSEAILKLDTLGHTGMIKDILVSKDKTEIISASDDKTIRVWDVATGKEKRKILGAIGAGMDGTINAIALSRDNRYLAVGASMSYYNKNKRVVGIRIYNYKTGKLLKILKSHTSVVYALNFSSDDNYLVSGSADTTVKIWQTANWNLQESINFHTKEVYAVKMLKRDNSYNIYSAGLDNKIALHQLKNKTLKYINSFTANYKLNSLATNGKDIATCGFGKEILVFDRNLNLKQTVQSETQPWGLAYSPDGKSLLAGTGAHPLNVNIYETNTYKKTASFKKHTNTTIAVNFIDNNTLVSGCSYDGIYIWNKKTTKVKKEIVGAGEHVWSVGIKGDEIAWGNILDIMEKNNAGHLQKSINLKDFTIKEMGQKSHFRRIETTNGNWSLEHSKGGDYGYSDAVLEIKEAGVVKSKIVKDASNGYGHNCYGWYKDFIISGGSHGQLKIYNKEGEKVASLVGHTGDVWSIAVDGDRLVSGSGDQTIKVWDLSKINTQNQKQKDKEINPVVAEVMNILMSEEYNRTHDEATEIALEYCQEQQIPLYKNNIVPQTIYPTLTLFISKENEYVANTKEGFFTASKGGAKFIGYHINQGADKEARYLTVDKFYDTFYRPDLIQKALNGEDLSKYAKDIQIDKIIGGGLPPIVKIKTSSHKAQQRDLTLELEVCQAGGGFDNLTLYLNSVAIDVISKDRALKLKTAHKNTQKDCIVFDKLISLQSGENTIGFKATNRVGTIESNLDEIVVNYKGKSGAKPNLHILSIGVDKYRDGDLRLQFSKADAKGFEESLSKASKALFKNVYTYNLYDKDVTKAKVLKMFEKIGVKTTREDVFVFYVAGHGITDPLTGNYYYLPVDFRYKNENSVKEQGISQNYLKLALSKIQAMKSLVILDTCNSGSFAEAMASRGLLEKTAINKLTRATGRATMVASSKSQVALEGYKGHGVFTYTLMEALAGKGYGSDNKITIKELAGYVEDVLPDRTYEKWGYEQIPQSTITGNDFPIGVK